MDADALFSVGVHLCKKLLNFKRASDANALFSVVVLHLLLTGLPSLILLKDADALFSVDVHSLLTGLIIFAEGCGRFIQRCTASSRVGLYSSKAEKQDCDGAVGKPIAELLVVELFEKPQCKARNCSRPFMVIAQA